MAQATLRRWVHRMFSGRTSPVRTKTHKLDIKSRLKLEWLEGRDVPSTSIPLNGTTWTQMGPQSITNGETPGQIAATGRFDSVAIDPLDPSKMWAASATGGIWRTTNGGAFWTPLTDQIERFDIPQAQTRIPLNSATIVKVVHTSAASPVTVYAVSKLGANGFLWVSTDGGDTWNRRGPTSAGGTTGQFIFNNRTINEFVVIPAGGTAGADLIYAAVTGTAAATPSGIYRSKDAGVTWDIITASGLPFSPTTQGFTDIDVDPSNKSVVYASVSSPVASSGVYRSTNAFTVAGAAANSPPPSGGANWQLRLGGSAFFSGTIPSRVITTISPKLTNVLFTAVADGGTGSAFAIYRSTNAGLSWTPLVTTAYSPLGNVPDFTSGQAGTYMNLVVDPLSPANSNQQRVFALGFGDSANNIIVSGDSGATWGDASIIGGSGAYSGVRGAVLYQMPTDTTSSHLMVATEGGIYGNSRTGAARWVSFNGTTGTGALNSTQVPKFGLALHPTNPDVAIINDAPFHTAAIFQDNRGWQTVDSNFTAPMHNVGNNPQGIGPVIYDFNSPGNAPGDLGLVWRVAQDSPLTQTIRLSQDGGLTWQDLLPGLPLGTPIIMNPSDSRELLIGFDDIYSLKFDAQGQFSLTPYSDPTLFGVASSWGAAFADAAITGTVTALAMSRQSGFVYAATTPVGYSWEQLQPNSQAAIPFAARTRLYVLDPTGGLTGGAPAWMELNLPTSISGNTAGTIAPDTITQLLVDPNNPLRVYMTTASGGVWVQSAAAFTPRVVTGGPLRWAPNLIPNGFPLPIIDPLPNQSGPNGETTPPFGDTFPTLFAQFASITANWRQINPAAGAGNTNIAPQNIVPNATGANFIALDPNQATDATDDILYLATNNGVYKLLINPAQTTNFQWVSVGGRELPNRPVTTLSLNTTTGILGAGLDGRGVWEIQVRNSVGGQVYQDTNGNGVQDAGENGIANRTIGLYQADLSVPGSPSYTLVATTETDGQGNYSFLNVPSGDWEVRLFSTVGWVQTSASPNIPLTPVGEQYFHLVDNPIVGVTGMNFGSYELTSIAGIKFDDINADGVRDTGELGLEGFFIYLDRNQNGILDWTDANANNAWDLGEGEQWTTTDANGAYSFTDLQPPKIFDDAHGTPPGTGNSIDNPNYQGIGSVAVPTFVVQEDLTRSPDFPLWTLTILPQPIQLPSGTDSTGNLVGNSRPGFIRGTLFYDINADTIRSAGEPGLPNWRVYIDSNGNGVLNWTDGNGNNQWDAGEGEQWVRTDALGAFAFAGLSAGTYNVRLDIKEKTDAGERWIQTTPNPDPIILTGTNSDNTPIFGVFQSFNPWIELGPRPITNGQAPGQAPATGRFDSVATPIIPSHPFDPSLPAGDPNANVLYAGSAGGGLWRSLDGGATWSVRSESFPDLSINTVKAFARTPNNTVYAAAGSGIYKSTDGGANFTLRTVPGGVIAMDMIPNLQFPNDPTKDIIFVVGGNGVLRSTDGGTTWMNISAGFPGGAAGQAFTDIDIEPAQTDPPASSFVPNVVYVSVGSPTGGAANGVYRIDNAMTAGGATPGSWTLRIGGSAFVPGVEPGVVRVSISPHAPSVLFAAFAERNAPVTGTSRLLGIFRSTDAGINWTGLYNPQVIPSGNVPNYMGGEGNYNNAIIVSPYANGAFGTTDPSRQIVIVGGYGDGGGNVLISFDSGTTWAAANDVSAGANGVGAYVNVHGFTFDSAGRVIASTEGGVYRLSTVFPGGGRNWVSLNGTPGLGSLNTVSIPQQGVATHPTNPYELFANTGKDHSAAFFNSRLPVGYGWTTLDSPTVAPFHTNNGPGRDGVGTVFYNYNDPNTLYRVVQYAGGGDTGWIRKGIRQPNGSIVWSNSAVGVPGLPTDGRLPVFPVIIDPGNSTHIWAGTTQVAVSNNGGLTWGSSLQTSTVGAGTFTPIPQIPDPPNSNAPTPLVTAIGVSRTPNINNNRTPVIFAARDDGGIWVLPYLPDAVPPANPATEWGDLTATHLEPDAINGAISGPVPGQVQGFPVRQIIVDPNDSMSAYVIDGLGVYHVTVSAGQPPAPQGATPPIWFSATWKLLSGTAGFSGALSLALDPRVAADPTDDILYVGTSSGVFRLQNPAVSTTWVKAGTGLPNEPITALDINTTTGLLTAGTSGRGVWQVQIRALISGKKYEDTNGDGKYWNDTNNNGVKDTGETDKPTIAGVVIRIIDNATNAVVATTVTDSDGFYEFRSLRAGTYRVEEVAPSGSVQTSVSPPVITLGETDSAVFEFGLPIPVPASVQLEPKLAFGNFRFATISGTKFEDRNNNGVKDASDPGMAGFHIYIDSNNNGVFDVGEPNQFTNANGNYSFTNLGPGTYSVREDLLGSPLPGQWTQTSANPAAITPTSGEVRSGVDFGNILIGRISGNVFNDLNGNGIRTPDEPGQGSMTVQLLDASNVVVRTVTSAADGTYSFISLPFGTYTVKQVLPSGWIQTSPAAPNPITYTRTISIGTPQLSNLDFGDFKLFTISGLKFEDLNGDGNRGPGENGLSGFVITVKNVNTNQTFTGVSDATGNFSIPNIGPGTYQVTEVQKSGFVQTSANPANFQAVSGTDQTFNFGNFRLISVSGTVFNDVNGNGIKDAGEGGLPGFNVVLTTTGGTPVSSATTDSSGNYTLTAIGPGNYILKQTPKNGWRVSSPISGQYNFTAFSSQNLTGRDFGDRSGGVFATGRGAGSVPMVSVRNISDNSEKLNFLAYSSSFRGGVEVATGFVNGPGTSASIVTGAGAGGGPHVRVFSSDNGEDQSNGGFFAYDSRFLGGVFVAVGDVNGDGFEDIITGPGAGGGPDVRVFSGQTKQLIMEFYAYDASWTGGVRVAAGDIDGDGKADIITGAGAGGGPHVKAFSGADGHVLHDFFAYSSSFTGGVYVAAGDFNGDGKADIVTGAGAGGGPHVRIFNGVTEGLMSEIYAYEGNYLGGVRVAARDLNFDGRADLLTAPGASRQPTINEYVLTNTTLNKTASFNTFDPTFLGGVFVG